MARPRGSYRWPPAYTRHKSGQARVRIPGQRDQYLGEYNSPQSWEKYHRVCNEAKQRGFAAPAAAMPDGITIGEMCAAFWSAAPELYPNLTTRVQFRPAIRIMVDTYGSTLARDFGPLKFATARDALIRTPYAKGRTKSGATQRTAGSVNQFMSCVMMVFRWGTRNELVPGSVFHALATVARVARGDQRLRKTKRKKPVSDSVIEATVEQLDQPWRDIVMVHRWTGMRSSELLSMRARDIDMSGDAWVYTPQTHKTERYDIERRIVIGTAARCLLAKYITTDLDAYLFTPRVGQQLLNEQTRRRATNAAINRVYYVAELRIDGQHWVARWRITTAFRRRRLGLVASMSEVEAQSLVAALNDRLRPRAQAFTGEAVLATHAKHRERLNRWQTAERRRAGIRPRPGDRHYSYRSYWCAVRRAADAADAAQHLAHPEVAPGDRIVPRWHPHLLRHAFASELKRRGGWDVAKTALGHTTVKQTATYVDEKLCDITQFVNPIGSSRP